ncbi:MAG: hypothetical protein ACWGQW_19545 [bacterium]
MDIDKEKNELKLQCLISERMMTDINSIKEKRGMSQAQVTRMLLDLGLEVHKDLSRVGIVRMVDMFYRLKVALQGIAEDESEGLKT